MIPGDGETYAKCFRGEDFAQPPLRAGEGRGEGESPTTTAFPAQAGTQVRGVESHVTPIIPHNHDPLRISPLNPP